MEQEEEFLLFFLHLLCPVGIRMFVIVAQDMQEPVNEQKVQFILQRNSLPFSIPESRFYGNDNIAQQAGIDAAAFTFQKRKENDIRGIITLQVALVDPGYFIVIGKKKTDIPVQTIHMKKKLFQGPPQSPQINFYLFLMVLNRYGHWHPFDGRFPGRFVRGN